MPNWREIRKKLNDQIMDYMNPLEVGELNGC